MITCHLCKLIKTGSDFQKSELLRKSPRCKECKSKKNKFYRECRENNVILVRYPKETVDMKACRICKIEKPISCFSVRSDSQSQRTRGECKDCQGEYNKLYYIDNADELKESSRSYHTEHKNEEEYITSRRTARRKTDIKPISKLRKSISSAIRKTLKSNNAVKSASCFKFLPYSSMELKVYIESLFSHPDNLASDGSVWMHQNNQGNYDPKTWNDNDPATWKWQLDHIIPQSDLPYDSMEHLNFLKCWALENLRPLSAKQNVLDGMNRTRHIKKTK